MNGKIKEEIIQIRPPYITLGQFLKFVSIIDEGYEAKNYLATHRVLINGEEDSRRGRKIYTSDIVEVQGRKFIIE